jgi:anti-anti-sigma regulatory factor
LEWCATCAEPAARDRTVTNTIEGTGIAMAFFSKPPAKKNPEPKSDLRPRAPSSVGTGHAASARELAAQVSGKAGRKQVEPTGGDITGTGGSLVQWTPAQSAFEVAVANPGLCAILENAALRFASGQADTARSLLEEGIANDADTRLSPLAWLALFDLLQRDGDKAGFDRLSMQYVVQFERSAPAWVERAVAHAGPRTAGGYLAVSGRLTAASAKQIEGIKQAVARKAESARLDLKSLQSFDDEGARMLADALSEARRARIALTVQQGSKLTQALDDAMKKGRECGEGAWLLSLELLQWASDRATFEDRAVDFAVTFELSPPSWEPPAPVTARTNAGAGDTPKDDESADPDVLKWKGVLAGSLAPQLGNLADSTHGRTVLVVDMSEVERIDFVCAGALLNQITRIESQRKAVQFVGATPIIRALLLLLGVSPRHFVKKAE